MTVRKPIPSSITSAARSCPETFVGTVSPYPTVVTVWTAHHRPDPMDGKFSPSITVMRIPAPSVIAVVAEAISPPAPRGVVARASILSSQRSSFVSSAIEVTFALAHSGPARGTVVAAGRARNAVRRWLVVPGVCLSRRSPRCFSAIGGARGCAPFSFRPAPVVGVLDRGREVCSTPEPVPPRG